MVYLRKAAKTIYTIGLEMVPNTSRSGIYEKSDLPFCATSRSSTRIISGGALFIHYHFCSTSIRLFEIDVSRILILWRSSKCWTSLLNLGLKKVLLKYKVTAWGEKRNEVCIRIFWPLMIISLQRNIMRHQCRLHR